MSDHAHTPGPWLAIERPYDKLLLVVIQNGRPHSMAIANVNDYGTEQEEAVANARLMAAAPELLAACEASLSRIEDLESRGNHTASTVKSQLIAAIAKAKGLQS